MRSPVSPEAIYLVTASNRGFGLAVAQMAEKRGHGVVYIARNDPPSVGPKSMLARGEVTNKTKVARHRDGKAG